MMIENLFSKTFRAPFILLISVFMLAACGGGGGNDTPTANPKAEEKPLSLTGPRPDVTEPDLNNAPDHQPFKRQAVPNNFSNAKVLSDGRIVGFGSLDASEQRRLFSRQPGQTGFNFLTPNDVSTSRFSYPLNAALYLKEGALFSIDSETPIKISGDEKVTHYWLSENEKKAFFINSTSTRIWNEVRSRYDYTYYNRLFMVDLATGVRTQFGTGNPNSYVIYEGNQNSDSIYVPSPRLLPDESRIVYVVENRNTGQVELRSARTDGSDDIVLHDNVVSQLEERIRDTFIYSFSPDSSKIVYGVTYQDEVELYSVTPDGKNNIKIVATEQISNLGGQYAVQISNAKSNINITADGSHLLFLARETATGDEGLFSVELDGARLVKVASHESITGFTLPSSLQNNAVIYASEDAIFSAPVTGGTSTELSRGFSIGYVSELTLADNDKSVVYVSRSQSTGHYDLHLSKLDASLTIHLSGAPSSHVRLQRLYKRNTFMLDPVGGRIAYRAYSGERGDVAIYTVNLDGTDRTKMTPDKLYENSNTGTQMVGFYDNKFYFIYEKARRLFTEFFSFDFDNSTLTNISTVWPAYVNEDAMGWTNLVSDSGLVQAFRTSNRRFNLNSAVQVITADSECRITALDNEAIRGDMVMERSGDHFYYMMSSPNRRVLYKTNTSSCDSFVMYDGSSAGRTVAVKLSSNEANVVYSTQEGNLFAIANDGSNTRLLNSGRTVGGIHGLSKGAFSITSDGSHVIYWADQEAVGTDELYSVTMDGFVTNKINGPLFAGGEVYTLAHQTFTPEVSSNGQWVIYKAQQESLNFQLYKSRLDGSENTLLSGDIVNSTLQLNRSYQMSQITDDALKVVYLTRDTVTNNTSIHVTNLEGAPSSTRLTAALQEKGGVVTGARTGFSLTPDSLAVVYLSQENFSSPRELFSAKLDGSGLVKLNQPIVDGGNVTTYSITTDGSQVVYLANARDVDVVGLYVSKLDGSGQRLLQENVVNMLTVGDSVVFRAVINGVDGIYAQSLSGGSEILVFEVPEGRNIQEMFLTADNRVNIFGDLRQYGVIEKFSFDF